MAITIQDKVGLQVDNVPTQNSDNAVKSSGIYNALSLKADKTEVAAVANAGAKNVLPRPSAGTTVTHQGVTFTVNADGSVTVNGTNTGTSEAYINFGTYTFKKGSYLLSGVPTGYANKMWTWIANIGDNRTEADKAITIAADRSTTCGVSVAAGQTVDNVTVYPMLRDAAITDGTYVPYGMSNAELTATTARNGGGKLALTKFDGDVAFGKYLAGGKRAGFMIGIDGLSTDNDEGYTHDRVVFSRSSSQKQIIHQCFDPSTNQFVREAVYTADEDTGWQTITNDYVDFSYRKKNGVVYLNFAQPAKQAISAAISNMATLPAGFRPSVTHYLYIFSPITNGQILRLEIRNNGNITFNPLGQTVAQGNQIQGVLSFPI